MGASMGESAHLILVLACSFTAHTTIIVQTRNQRGKACWIPKNVCDTIIRLYNRRIICTEAVMLRNLNVAKCKVYSLYKSKHKKEKNKRKNLEYEKTANEDHINSYLHKSR